MILKFKGKVIGKLKNQSFKFRLDYIFGGADEFTGA